MLFHFSNTPLCSKSSRVLVAEYSQSTAFLRRWNGAASPLISTNSHVEEVKREGSHVFVATWTVTLKSNGSLVGPKSC